MLPSLPNQRVINDNFMRLPVHLIQRDLYNSEREREKEIVTIMTVNRSANIQLQEQ